MRAAAAGRHLRVVADNTAAEVESPAVSEAFEDDLLHDDELDDADLDEDDEIPGADLS